MPALRDVSISFYLLTFLSQASALPFVSPYGNWSSVPCSAIPDYADNAINSWAIADTSGAYEEALNDFDNTPGKSPVFVDAILTFFNGPSNWNCSDIGTGGPCNGGMVTCTIPASYLIGQSFSAIQNVHAEIFQQLSNAEAAITTQMGNFASTFSPQLSSDIDIIKDILDTLSFVIGLQSAFVWNTILKTSSIFTNDADKVANAVLQGLHGQAKDSFNAAIGFSITTAKDNLPAIQSALGTQNDLTGAMGVFIQNWQENVQQYLSYIFSGKGQALTDLFNHINNGLALSIPAFGSTDLENNAFKVTYAYLIQKAWAICPQNLHPVIIGPTNDACNQKAGSSVSQYMSDSTAAQVQVCYNNQVFYVVNPVINPPAGGSCDPTSRDCFGPVGGETVSFNTLPGGTTGNLDGTNWAGVQLSDMVISSYQGYQLNNNQNGYQMPEMSQAVDGAGNEGDLIFENGIQTPGIFSLTICPNADDVARNTMAGKSPC